MFEPRKLESGTHPVRAQERRELARVRVNLSADVEWEARHHDAIISDLGVGGAFLRCSISPPYGVYVHILLDDGKGPVHLVAIVRWADERGFGVQFVQMGVYATAVIAGHVARAKARA